MCALHAAIRAQRQWAATAPRRRSEILRHAFELMLARRDDLALLMTLEMGKPVDEACGEVGYAAEFLRWFSEESVRIDGGYATVPDGSKRALVMAAPVGPCVLITPWNFPLAMGARKIGPVAAIQTFGDDDVVALPNDTPWGLVGYVFTRDLDLALNTSEELQVGMVGLNAGVVSDLRHHSAGSRNPGSGARAPGSGSTSFSTTS